MTVLNLTRLWLNRLDTGEAISGASGPGPATGIAMDGAVRTYAAGRRRSISTAGLKVEVPRTMVALDFATKDRLISWVGTLVQLRDFRGGKWYGVFFELNITEYRRPDLYSASFTLQGTTTTEV